MLRAALRSVGADRAVVFTVLNRLTVMVSAVVTLGLVITYLPPDRQGYYFTFASLLVLQSFLELGMGIVLVQFVSHEWSSLQLTDGKLAGNALALERVGALVRVGLRWYLGTAIAFAVVVGFFGKLLLTRHGIPEGVLAPWWLLCGAVSLSLVAVPLRSVLEGSNQVARMQKLATLAFLSGSIAGWISIILGLDLYSLAVATGTTAVLGLWLYGRAGLPFLRAARLMVSQGTFSWRQEFWPQQWRVALSLMSGFFIFQSFVPIIFYFHGAVVAGQMGASLQVFNAVHTLGQAWGNARAPRFGILGAIGGIPELRSLIRETVRRGTLTAAACSLLALGAVGLLGVLEYKADRFIGLAPLAMLLGTSVLLQRTAVETLAVRFQKTEPFVLLSTISAVLVIISNIVAGRYFGTTGACTGFAAVMVCVTAPWVHRTYTAQMIRFTEQTGSSPRSATA